MATFRERYPRNTPGKYYIDAQCTDCDLCRETAPRNIRRDDEMGISYVFRQPTTAEEVAACEEGVAGCPTAAVGNDGDKFDWRTTPIYDWTKYSETLRPLLNGLTVVPDKPAPTIMTKRLRAAARVTFRLIFGLLAVLMGSAIILWVVYNEFIHRLPQYTGTHWWHPLGIGPALIGTGIYWLRSLRSPSDNEHTRT